MKSSINTRISAVLICLLFAGGAFAQKVTRNDTLPILVITSKSIVSQKVMSTFKKDFQEAVGPRWFKMDKNYLVKFFLAEQKNHALYDKKGNIIYHLAYGNESNLPKEVKDRIMLQDPGCNIITAIKVNQQDRTIWVANLEVKKQLVLVRDEEGELTEMDRNKDASI